MTMWAYRLEGPLTLVRYDVDAPRTDSLVEGEVLLRFRAGGVCGSDIARCLDGGDARVPGPFGLSLHEIVADVVASCGDLAVDDRVVGWVGRSIGLSEYVVTPWNQGLTPSARYRFNLSPVCYTP